MKLVPIEPFCANLTVSRSVYFHPDSGYLAPSRSVSHPSQVFDGRLMATVEAVFDDLSGFKFRVCNGRWEGLYDLDTPNHLVCFRPSAPSGREIHSCEPFQVVVPGSLTNDECESWYTGNYKTPEQLQEDYEQDPGDYVPY